ncbi:hypothetical protein BDZ91DRAFT_837442 [Kalaharituber pfeilii]|nr:hypothetical protein BDZ91DRAFT_837442 [Kalaharituber pfeilii]
MGGDNGAGGLGRGWAGQGRAGQGWAGQGRRGFVRADGGRRTVGRTGTCKYLPKDAKGAVGAAAALHERERAKKGDGASGAGAAWLDTAPSRTAAQPGLSPLPLPSPPLPSPPLPVPSPPRPVLELSWRLRPALRKSVERRGGTRRHGSLALPRSQWLLPALAVAVRRSVEMVLRCYGTAHLQESTSSLTVTQANTTNGSQIFRPYCATLLQLALEPSWN